MLFRRSLTTTTLPTSRRLERPPSSHRMPPLRLLDLEEQGGCSQVAQAWTWPPPGRPAISVKSGTRPVSLLLSSYFASRSPFFSVRSSRRYRSSRRFFVHFVRLGRWTRLAHSTAQGDGLAPPPLPRSVRAVQHHSSPRRSLSWTARNRKDPPRASSRRKLQYRREEDM